MNRLPSPQRNLKPLPRLWNKSSSSWSGKHITYGLCAVATLGVADHMTATPRPVGELARQVGAQPDFLYRVMRMLASLGVFVETPDNSFALTPVGECLKTDAPVSIRYLAMAWGDSWSTRAF